MQDLAPNAESQAVTETPPPPAVPRPPAPAVVLAPAPPPPLRPQRAEWWKSYAKLVGILALTWLLPASWVALSPPFSKPLKPAQTTRDRLNALNKGLRAFRERHRAAPLDLTALRAFARVEKLPFDAHDAFGQRFQYVRLSERNYLLRSFGADGVQNTFGSAPDMGVARWGKRPEMSPTFRFGASPTLGYYPAGLLYGADAPNRSWLAKLFVDVDAATRQLVVRHRRKNGLFMVAPHDQVEEFLWLPNGEQLIYTASGSFRHRDGLYLWNLPNDEIINLVDVAEQTMPISPAARSAGFFFSLAGVTAGSATKPPIVYSYFNFRSDGPLAPEEFFVREQVLAFAIPDLSDGKAQPPRFLGKDAPGLDLNVPLPLASPLDLGGRVDGRGGLRSQQDWLALPVAGDAEQVLLAWHTFIDKQSASPLFPYALWALSSFYNESYAILANHRRRDAEVLRTYGTEIARALINYPLSPTYLRSLALHLYENLMEGRAANYQLGRLVLPRGVAVEQSSLPPSPAKAKGGEDENDADLPSAAD
jgi:hypothetical protein